MPKVLIFNNQFRITIPKELALSKGWGKKGTRLRFVEDADGVVILKKLKC